MTTCTFTATKRNARSWQDLGNNYVPFASATGASHRRTGRYNWSGFGVCCSGRFDLTQLQGRSERICLCDAVDRFKLVVLNFAISLDGMPGYGINNGGHFYHSQINWIELRRVSSHSPLFRSPLFRSRSGGGKLTTSAAQSAVASLGFSASYRGTDGPVFSRIASKTTRRNRRSLSSHVR
ncbi:hypothetical protein Poly21_55500 [Allorhodopirellula heiligendammensis]|uniref:Uncharacterized protein n=1 Tax=Allorhodopirellula heiligendammensis TaxID=2714739 RepID=A0A5C6BBW4_9BACT|nr:hypothetical protein Poly21_55500 [Allorhodopirellula heiligendammensis]